MKLLTVYAKEMKIAARGFYFYIELFVAVIMLIILLFGISENPDSRMKEFLLYDDSMDAVIGSFEAQRVKEGKLVILEEPTEWVLKPAKFTLTNRDTGVVTDYDFPEEKTLLLETRHSVDPETGRVEGTQYLLDTIEDLYRIAYQERAIGAVLSFGNDGRVHYEYVNQGYETDRLIDAMYILHNENLTVLEAQAERQQVRELGSTDRLNNRENLVPAFLAFAGSLMGIFIVVAYVYLDKDEGVINALVVTPVKMMSYLLSKIMVICTTIILSSAIIVIPVMGAGPNYPVLILYLIITSFAFSAAGLLISSFFDTLSKAFGILYGLMIALMIPGFSYYIPSFDPLWLRFFPSYPLLQGFRDLLLGSGDLTYVWVASAGFLIGGVLLLWLSDIRFRKSLRI